MTTINSFNMKQLIEYTRSFFKSHFGLKLYLAMAFYFAFLMIVNYSLDLERGWLYSYMGEWKSILFFFLSYGISFYGAIGVIWAVDKKRLQLGKTFWVKSLLGILFLAFYRSGFYLVVERFIYEFPPTTRRFYAGIFRNVFRLVVVLGGLLAFKQVFDKNEKWGLYGLGKQGGNPWAYMFLLIFVSPFIFLATYLPGFLEVYPLYKGVGGARFAEYYAISEWIPAFIFEFQYLLDFINTELFFRGFLVVGFIKLLGKEAIFPMIAMYVALHFGKPWGEAIGAIFMGYVLGAIAYKGKNIWGGFYFHMGIAFLMETFAFLMAK